MRFAIVALASFACLAVSATATPTAPQNLTDEQTAQGASLALVVGDALTAQCRAEPTPAAPQQPQTGQTEAQPDQTLYLQIIAQRTAQSDIHVIVAALRLLNRDQGLCPGARAAVAAALQQAELALNTTDPTGGIGAPGGVPFATGGTGGPGGGGGGYVE